MKVLLWIIGVPVGGFALLFLVFLVQELANPKTTVQRIDDNCQQEFGSRGKLAVDECKLRTSLRYLSDRERAKDDAAYNREEARRQYS